MIKLMIFDHDMTIVDSSHAITAGFNCVADAEGLPRVTREQVMRHIAKPMPDFCRGVLGDCRQEWIDLYHKNVAPLEHSLIRPFPDLEEAMSALRGMGIALAVASNRDNPRVAMERSGTARYFDAILGPGGALPYKPDPAMVLRLMEQFEVPAERTVYVGDSAIDIETALAARIRGVGVTLGNYTRAQLMDLGAWRVVDALSELPALAAGDERQVWKGMSL